MTDTESLIAEVRQLRADVARLHAGVLVRHTWARRNVPICSVASAASGVPSMIG